MVDAATLRMLFVACLCLAVSACDTPVQSQNVVATQRTSQSGKSGKPLAYSLDPDRAFNYLLEICKIGPRVTGTEGMRRQQELIIEHFGDFDVEIQRQEFQTRHPVDGTPVDVVNLIVRWFPERTNRVLICAHYDTRPYPDQDPVNPRGVFIGANDGASGTALLMELAHSLPTLSTSVGVDLVFFDAEELKFDTLPGGYFIGSEEFAKQYAMGPREFDYKAGILVDMVADKDLKLYKERNSYRYAKSLVNEVWAVAKRQRINEFNRLIKTEVLDDHIKLNEIARIPTIDIIDFEYPRQGRQSYWHTTQDTPDKCSGESICKVASVILGWLEQQ